MAVADRKGSKPLAKVTPNQFKKKWNGPCTNHEFLVKHLTKDCTLLKRFFKDLQQRGARHSRPEDVDQGDDKDEPQGTMPNQKSCLMIIPGPEACGRRRTSKVEPTTPRFL